MQRRFQSWRDVFSNPHMLEIFLIQNKIYLPSRENALIIIRDGKAIIWHNCIRIVVYVSRKDDYDVWTEKVIPMPDGSFIHIVVYEMCGCKGG